VGPQTVTSPDGRVWRVETKVDRMPRWVSGTLSTSPATASGNNVLAQAAFRMLVGGVILPLLIFLIMLPFKLLFSQTRLVIAESGTTQRRWRTRAPDLEQVLADVVAALGRGDESAVPANATVA
jgi:hypothetical protein